MLGRGWSWCSELQLEQVVVGARDSCEWRVGAPRLDTLPTTTTLSSPDSYSDPTHRLNLDVFTRLWRCWGISTVRGSGKVKSISIEKRPAVCVGEDVDNVDRPRTPFNRKDVRNYNENRPAVVVGEDAGYVDWPRTPLNSKDMRNNYRVIKTAGKVLKQQTETPKKNCEEFGCE